MTRALQLILLALAVSFTLALATLGAYNAAKSAVRRRSARLSLAALIAELAVGL